MFQRIRAISQRTSSLTKNLSLLGPLGVYGYIVGFAIPFPWDIPLIMLATASVVAVVTSSEDFTYRIPRLPLILVSLFLVSTALSILMSDDIGRSLRLSASLLPALLLFFMITTHLNDNNIGLLYFSFSIVAFILAATSIWFAWQHGFSLKTAGKANSLVHWSPILVSRNDLSFLSLIAPLSLALILGKSQSFIKAFAILSIVLSAVVIVAYQSRGATVTLVVALAAAALFLRIKLALVLGLATVTTALIVDALLGFPLTERFSSLLDRPIPGRLHQWGVAWEMFMSAPIFGHGPHAFVLFHKTPWPHNLYLEILAEQGLVGFVCILSVLAFGVVASLRMRHTDLVDVRLLAAGVFGSIIALLIAGVFELSLLRQWVVIMFFVIFGIVTRLNNQVDFKGG